MKSRLFLSIVLVFVTLVFVNSRSIQAAPANTTHCGTISANETWSSVGNVHIVTCNVTVATGVTLTIMEDTVVKFNAGTGLIVNGALRVLGTAGHTVYFTSYRDDSILGDTDGGGASNGARGDWSRIEFQDASNDAASLIDHAEIRYGGGCCYFGGVTLVSASPAIQNSTFVNNQYYALLGNVTSFPALTNNSWINNNGVNGFALQGGTIGGNATWNITDTAYFLIDNVSVGVGATLTVNPGVVVKFNASRALLVQGALRLLGASGNPVYFTSLKDDTVQYDTNNDGATVPNRGDWSRIEFQDASNDANSLIDHAEIRYGGNCCYYGGVTLVSASPAIQNSTFVNNQYYGILASSSTPVLGCNNIYSNGSHGLYNSTTSITVTAENQWWGNINGPYHPSLNPGGTGNAVSNGVDFIPWRSYACPPDPPTNLIATAISQTQISLSWQDNSIDESEFHIERSPDGSTSWAEIGTTGANITVINDNVPSCSTPYYYRVRAHRNGDNQYSDYSNVASAVCPPSNLTATLASSTQIDLSWQDNSWNESEFHVERSPNGSTGWMEAGTAGANVTSFSNSALNCSTTYYYRVRAHRQSDGQFTTYSNVANASTPPCSPNGATANATSLAQTIFNWVDNSPDESEFHVERSPDGSTSWQEIGTTTANVATYNDAVSCVTPYYYRVRAYRYGDSQFSEYSNVASAVCPPSNLTATPISSTQISLNWQDNSWNESEFDVERSPNGTTGWAEIGTVPANVTSFANSGLSCSTTYYYRVRAHRHSDGQFTVYGNVTSVTTPPCAPTLRNAVTISETQVNLTWQDNSPDETTFRVERSLDGIGWTEVYTVSANIISTNDIGLTCSTLYYYRVRGHRQGDSQYSEYSGVKNTKTSPCHPTNLTPTAASRTQIDLSWQDNSPDESHFHIERSPNGSTGWIPIVVPADTTSYGDTGLWCGTVYYYRVRAYRQNDGQYSNYSDTANTAPAACLKVYIPVVLKN